MDNPVTQATLAYDTERRQTKQKHSTENKSDKQHGLRQTTGGARKE